MGLYHSSCGMISARGHGGNLLARYAPYGHSDICAHIPAVNDHGLPKWFAYKAFSIAHIHGFKHRVY